MSVLSRLSFTADDWGLSPGVNEGILDLCRRGIVTRVSVMVTASHVGAGLGALAVLPGVELGLHFDLTHGKRSLASVFVDSVVPSRKEKLRSLFASELRGQLETMRRLGIPARYVDGHQHVHLTPGWVQAAAPVLREFGIHRVRLPLDWRLLKTSRAPVAILAALGKREFRRYGLEFTRCWYPLASDFKTAETFLARASRLKGESPVEVIVHPAAYLDFDAHGIDDDLREPRLGEYQVLTRLMT